MKLNPSITIPISHSVWITNSALLNIRASGSSCPNDSLILLRVYPIPSVCSPSVSSLGVSMSGCGFSQFTFIQVPNPHNAQVTLYSGVVVFSPAASIASSLSVFSQPIVVSVGFAVACGSPGCVSVLVLSRPTCMSKFPFSSVVFVCSGCPFMNIVIAVFSFVFPLILTACW